MELRDMAKHGKTRMTPVAPTIDVDELGQLGDLFTLSDLPADLAPAVMQFLQTLLGDECSGFGCC